MIRLGVLCPAEIARRRFMPALNKHSGFSFVGVGMHRREKAEQFLTEYPGILFESYEQLVSSDQVDAVYIPLPPALHFRWAKEALSNGKHVLLEKPFTLNYKDTEELVSIAVRSGLALHENYMFVFHQQISTISDYVLSGELGDIRLYRMSFGFPMRSKDDFRYDKDLGGGALMDAGGYCIKLASILLGKTARVVTSVLNGAEGFNVDLYGSATMVNDEGVTAQLSFGMDNDYQCMLEIWGSKGTLSTGRIFTAPEDLTTTAVVRNNGKSKEIVLSKDDTFFKSVNYFENCICDCSTREESYNAILRQAQLVEQFRMNRALWEK